MGVCGIYDAFACVWCLGPFSSYWVTFSSFDVMVCAKSYCICYACLVYIPWRFAFFSEGKSRRDGSEGKGRQQEMKKNRKGKLPSGCIIWEKNKNEIRFKNKKQKAISAYPSLPPRNRGTSAFRQSPRERIKGPKTGTSVQLIISPPSLLQQEQEIHWVSGEKVTELRALHGFQSRPQMVYRSSSVVRAGREERRG